MTSSDFDTSEEEILFDVSTPDPPDLPFYDDAEEEKNGDDESLVETKSEFSERDNKSEFDDNSEFSERDNKSEFSDRESNMSRAISVQSRNSGQFFNGKYHPFAPAIDPRSQKMVKRHGKVEDNLYRLHGQWEMKRQEKLREKEAKEVEGVTFKPQINKSSAALPRASSPHMRLHEYARVNEEKRERLRQTLEESDSKSCTNTPRINSVSRSLERSIDALQDWEKRKNAKLQAQIEARERAAAEPNKAAPKICPGTKHILAARRASTPSKSAHIRLSEQGEIARQAQERKREAAMKVEAERAKPQICPKSQKLMSQRNVRTDAVARLYAEADEKRKKQEAMRAEKEVEDTVDDHTGQALFTPFISPSAQQIVREEAVEDRLMRLAQELEHKKHTQRMMELDEAKNQNRLRINPVSALIASERRQAGEEEHYAKPIRQIRSECLVADEPPFAPTISRNSQEIELSKTNGQRQSFSERLEQMNSWSAKMEQQRKLKEEAEVKKRLEGCTFQPDISPLRIRGAPEHAVRVPAGSTVASRSMDWLRQKEQRRAMEQEAALKETMAQCTFTPTISRPSTPTSSRPQSPSMRSHSPTMRSHSPTMRSLSPAFRSSSPSLLRAQSPTAHTHTHHAHSSQQQQRQHPRSPSPYSASSSRPSSPASFRHAASARTAPHSHPTPRTTPTTNSTTNTNNNTTTNTTTSTRNNPRAVSPVPGRGGGGGGGGGGASAAAPASFSALHQQQRQQRRASSPSLSERGTPATARTPSLSERGTPATARAPSPSRAASPSGGGASYMQDTKSSVRKKQQTIPPEPFVPPSSKVKPQPRVREASPVPQQKRAVSAQDRMDAIAQAFSQVTHKAIAQAHPEPARAQPVAMDFLDEPSVSSSEDSVELLDI